MNPSPADVDAQVTIRRMINAPQRKVFDAWTQPEHLKNWWRKDPTWSTELAEVDFRVGGKYSLGMRDPARPHPYVCFGEFVEINEPNKVVYTWSWEPPGMDVSGSLVTVEFLENGDSTELVLIHEQLPNPEAAQAHSQGWTACIRCFIELVESK